MANSIGEGKITLDCFWNGPNKLDGGWTQGGLDVGVIDLIFQNSQSTFSVNLPPNLPTTKPTKVSFVMRKPSKFVLETHPDKLQVTIEKLSGLTLKVGYIDKSPKSGNIKTLHPNGQWESNLIARRTDSPLKLKMPDEWIAGEHYHLYISSSENLELRAQIVKAKKKTKVAKSAQPSQNEAEKQELVTLLSPMLTPLASMKSLEFFIQHGFSLRKIR